MGKKYTEADLEVLIGHIASGLGRSGRLQWRDFAQKVSYVDTLFPFRC